MKIYVNSKGQLVDVVDSTFVANSTANIIRFYFVDDDGNVIDLPEINLCNISVKRSDGFVVANLMAVKNVAEHYWEYVITETDGVLYRKGALEVSAQLAKVTYDTTAPEYSAIVATATTTGTLYVRSGSEGSYNYTAISSGFTVGATYYARHYPIKKRDVIATIVTTAHVAYNIGEADADELELALETARLDRDALQGQITRNKTVLGFADTYDVATEKTVEERLDGHDQHIADAEADITTIDGRLTTAEADIDALELRATTAEADVDALETKMTAAETGLADRYTKEIADGKYRLISDSYTKTQTDKKIAADIEAKRGAANGITPLNAQQKIPVAYLPTLQAGQTLTTAAIIKAANFVNTDADGWNYYTLELSDDGVVIPENPRAVLHLEQNEGEIASGYKCSHIMSYASGGFKAKFKVALPVGTELSGLLVIESSINSTDVAYISGLNPIEDSVPVATSTKVGGISAASPSSEQTSPVAVNPSTGEAFVETLKSLPVKMERWNFPSGYFLASMWIADGNKYKQTTYAPEVNGGKSICRFVIAEASRAVARAAGMSSVATISENSFTVYCDTLPTADIGGCFEVIQTSLNSSGAYTTGEVIGLMSTVSKSGNYSDLVGTPSSLPQSSYKTGLRIQTSAWAGQILTLFSGSIQLGSTATTIAEGDFSKYRNATTFPLSAFDVGLNFTVHHSDTTSYANNRTLGFYKSAGNYQNAVYISIYDNEITVRTTIPVAQGVPICTYIKDTSTTVYSAQITADSLSRTLPVTQQSDCSFYVTNACVSIAAAADLKNSFEIGTGYIRLKTSNVPTAEITGDLIIKYETAYYTKGYVFNMPDKAELVVNDIAFNAETGIFTITKTNGTTSSITIPRNKVRKTINQDSSNVAIVESTVGTETKYALTITDSEVSTEANGVWIELDGVDSATMAFLSQYAEENIPQAVGSFSLTFRNALPTTWAMWYTIEKITNN